MSSPANFLKTARLTHLYLGVFIAPALVFFAFTGFIQTFSLHETSRGSSYQPPAILVKLGQLHKKQTLIVPVRRPPAAAPEAVKPMAPPSASPSPAPAARPADAPPAKTKNLLPMKLFFALVSVGLVVSTATGVYMAYKYNRNGRLITALLLAGIIVPALFTVF